MYTEEFYNADPAKIVEAAYYTTLQYWLVYNDMDIYEGLIEHYKENEVYEVCDGIQRGIDRINEIMDSRFDEATPISENEEEVIISHEEHQRVGRLIFKDILQEIYEYRIKKIEKTD
jgi:hypothetical protein